MLALRRAQCDRRAAGFVFMACFFLLAGSKAHVRIIAEDLMRDEQSWRWPQLRSLVKYLFFFGREPSFKAPENFVSGKMLYLI